MSILMFIVLGLVAYQYLVTTFLRQETQPDYSPVRYDTGWIALNDGIDVRLEPGASLLAAHRNVNGSRRFRLLGAARFRVSPIHRPESMLRADGVVVETPAGLVIAGESDFNVTTNADTTLVQVHPLGPRRALQPQQRTVSVATRFGNESYQLALRDLDRARLVKGHDPQLLRLIH